MVSRRGVGITKRGSIREIFGVMEQCCVLMAVVVTHVTECP